MTKQEEQRLRVNLQSCKFDVVRQVVQELGYEEVGDEQDDWNLLWSDLSVSTERVSKLRQYQRLNHFPSMLEICRKTPLSRHMARMAQRLPDEYNFYPQSYNLPDQLDDLLLQLRKNEAKLSQGLEGEQTFILKPTNGSQGHGIHLVQTCGQMQELAREVDISNIVAQVYIAKPLLLDGFKFDLRIYALVRSVDPLCIYLYDEGLARLATVPYQAPHADNLETSTMHLTNYAVNKRSSAFISGDGPSGATGQGSKRPASSVLHRVAAQRGCSYSHLIQGITDIIVRTVLAVQPLLSHKYHTAISCGNREAPAQCAACPCPSLDHWNEDSTTCSCPPSQCFELLGYDILLDSDLKPWLLEVNHSPSLSCDAVIDTQVKTALLTDTIGALGQQPEDRQCFAEEQHRAMTERLYSRATTSLRRPLTCVPKSKQLRAAYAALEDLEARLPPSRPMTARGPQPSLTWAAADGATTTTSVRQPSASGSRPVSAQVNGVGKSRSMGSVPLSVLGPGLVPDQQILPGSIGRYTKIYPPAVQPQQQRSRLLKIMTAASGAFPDQRCSCAYCARRTRARHFANTSRELQAAAAPLSAKQRRRPASASCFPPTSNTAVAGMSAAPVPSASMLADPQTLATLVPTATASTQQGDDRVSEGGGGSIRPCPSPHGILVQQKLQGATKRSSSPAVGLLGRPPQAPVRQNSGLQDTAAGFGSPSSSRVGPPASALASGVWGSSSMARSPSVVATAQTHPLSAAAGSLHTTTESSSPDRLSAPASINTNSKIERFSISNSDLGGRNSSGLWAEDCHPRQQGAASDPGQGGSGGETSAIKELPASPAKETPPRGPPRLSSSSSSSTDRQLQRYMKLLYPSHTRAVCSPLSQHPDDIEEGQQQATACGTTAPKPVPGKQRLQSAPLVPRIATLGSASARRSSGRHHGGAHASVDPQLMLLRMKTTTVLSNNFVTCYLSDLPTDGKNSQSLKVKDQRSLLSSSRR